jgi:REP element-mobilizing transposase RayT
MMTPTKGYSQLKKGRYSAIGMVYHVVFSTKNNQPIFKKHDHARCLTLLLKSDQDRNFTKTLSFVVMPDHIHWLFKLNIGDISQAVQRVKSLFTKHTGLRIWNTGFYDHAIRSEESLIDVARYIVANPLRAGIVKSVGEYPYWDSIWLE